jgi:hypothetical protein
MVFPNASFFGPIHVRGLLDIPTEQLRNWRRILPSIGFEREGRTVFDFADLIALAVIRRLVVEMEIRIGLLAPVAAQLVDACRSVALEDAAGLRIEFEPVTPRIAVRRADAPPSHGLAAIVQLGPIVGALRARLTLPPEGPNGLPLFRQ